MEIHQSFTQDSLQSFAEAFSITLPNQKIKILNIETTITTATWIDNLTVIDITHSMLILLIYIGLQLAQIYKCYKHSSVKSLSATGLLMDSIWQTVDSGYKYHIHALFFSLIECPALIIAN